MGTSTHGSPIGCQNWHRFFWVFWVFGVRLHHMYLTIRLMSTSISGISQKKSQRRALQRPVLWLELRSYSGHLTAGRWSDGPCGHQNGTLEKGLIRNCMNGTRRHFGQKKEKELKIGKSIELGEHQAFIHCHMDVAGPGSRTTSPLARCRKTTNLETCHREHVTAWRFAPTSVHSGYD